MAGTTQLGRAEHFPASATRMLRIEYNKLVDDCETLRAQLALSQIKVNAIITAAATSLAAVAAVAALTLTAVDTASDLVAAKVGDQDGVTTA